MESASLPDPIKRLMIFTIVCQYLHKKEMQDNDRYYYNTFSFVLVNIDMHG